MLAMLAMLAPQQLAHQQTFCDEVLDITQLAQAVCVLDMVGGRR